MTEENIRIVKDKENLLHGGSKHLVKLFLLLLDHYNIDKAQVFSVVPADNEFMSKMRKFGENRGFPRDQLEFHMLYGIKSTEQRRLSGTGYRVGVLISFGDAWFPWYMRRLAERPANLGFVLKNLFGR